MRKLYHKIVPEVARKAIGQAISKTVMFHRDSVSVRYSLKNLTPVVLKKNLRLLSNGGPTVAAVFAGRNDDFVADNEARIRAVIEWNSHVLANEVIFVEWNPLPDRPLLGPQLTKDYPNLRCFVVPNRLHEEICTNPRIPVMEYFAKNVGIRRAMSEYISATNSDILWDEDVGRMRALLSPELVFRTRRIELQWDGVTKKQSFLRDPKNRLEYRNGWRQVLDYGCGDFTLAHRDLWHRARGYDESMKNERISCDGRGMLQLLELGGKQVHMGHHYHLFHETASSGKGNISHGQVFEYWKNLPYQNPENWGLGDCGEVEVAERVWTLERGE